MNAKRFFYVSAAILLLVAAYTVGAHRADAQSGGQFAGIAALGEKGMYAITSNGDVYARSFVPRDHCGDGLMQWQWTCTNVGQATDSGWVYMGNVLGGTISVDARTMTDVKRSYRK